VARLNDTAPYIRFSILRVVELLAVKYENITENLIERGIHDLLMIANRRKLIGQQACNTRTSKKAFFI